MRRCQTVKFIQGRRENNETLNWAACRKPDRNVSLTVVSGLWLQRDEPSAAAGSSAAPRD